MTAMSKPSLTVKKTLLISGSHCDEEVIEMQPNCPRKPHSAGTLLCIGITMFLLILIGVITSLQFYELVSSSAARRSHFKGFCSIPLSRDLQMLESRKMPLLWQANPNTVEQPDVQMVTLMNSEESEHLLNLLREVLDIDVDDSVEKISVFNNGHPVSFIHDFESNVTDIVDEQRCFTMDLDLEMVLQPEVFVLGLEHGDDFDVSRVRSSLRAVLPAAVPERAARRTLPERCQDKPTYTLLKDTGVVIRKRSADAPPHDYMQFAGKRIQEIEISNLAEVLEYEQNEKQGA